MRLGLSLREVERRSLKIVEGRANSEFNLSRGLLADIETGLYIPGSFKVVSLAEIYGLTIAQIEQYYGIQPEDISKERPVFRPPKTQLLTSPDESTRYKEGVKPATESESLATRLFDIWGEVPAPMMRLLALGKSLFGYIGAADWTMWPLLPPGTFVQIDPKQTRVQKEKGPLQKDAGQSQFARPIYFLDIRTGYACGWCEIKDGVLTLLPHPHSGQQTRTFRYPHEAEVVGRVTAVAMGITEKNFMPIEEQARRNEPKK